MTKANKVDSACSSSSLAPSPAFVVFTGEEYKQLIQRIKELESSGQQHKHRALVKSPEMASILSISLNQLDKMRAIGAIPSVKIGNARRYDPTAVLAAIEEAGE